VTGVNNRERSATLPHGIQGAADASFACTVRAFSQLFPGRRFGGGALAVYLHGEPVVDVWTGYADRRGTEYWTADTGAMVWSVTKGMASTVIHRLADRGLIDYDTPVAEYWPEFGANGKAEITVRDAMRHRAGLSQLNGVSKAELLDHQAMESRLAAASVNKVLYGKPAYHALTYGWLMSGLARAVTGKGMRVLIREELAGPLNTDGLHLGRPPADSLCSFTRPDSTAYQPWTSSPERSITSPLAPCNVYTCAATRSCPSGGNSANQRCARRNCVEGREASWKMNEEVTAICVSSATRCRNASPGCRA